MTAKSKIKGNTWEREISKFLSKHLGGNFMRVANSGGYIGGSNIFRKKNMSESQILSAKGDIIPPDHLTKMNIEAKNYADIAFNQILDGKCLQLNKWIDQTEIVEGEEDISFTIFKITRKGSWIVFSSELIEKFNLKSYMYYEKDEDSSYIIANFEEFILNNIEVIKEICK